MGWCRGGNYLGTCLGPLTVSGTWAFRCTAPKHSFKMSGAKRTWFDRGVAAFQRDTPAAPACYVCALCVRGFGGDALDEGQVAIEHAPPEAVGGKPVCLTCTDCNNNAGRTVDAHMARRETDTTCSSGPCSARGPLGSRSAEQR